ncbi:hypothetical protein TNCV_2599931 [Trichonephila clavipes]|nr:hypothetical protein TNCV_2599931 [Trichonephila clavipes]
MALSDSLPQINLGVQGGTQGGPHTATRETCEHSMAEAVREAVDENDGKRDLTVAVDGSWQKRGFSSKNGLVTVTSVDTGKVIDVEVFFKTLYLSERNQASSKL